MVFRLRASARRARARIAWAAKIALNYTPCPHPDCGAVRARPAHVDVSPTVRCLPSREFATVLNSAAAARRALPSVDRLLKLDAVVALISRHGRPLVVETLRAALDEQRGLLAKDPAATPLDDDALTARCAKHLQALSQPSLRPVFNLTGTVLHTNLGRALYPQVAAAAALQ